MALALSSVKEAARLHFGPLYRVVALLAREGAERARAQRMERMERELAKQGGRADGH